MTQNTDHGIPQASMREQWSVSSVQRLAWAMGHPAAAPAAAQGAAAGSPRVARIHDPARHARRMDALARLAADPHATPAERALAAQRLAELTPYPIAS